jgi:hypothetical protein
MFETLCQFGSRGPGEPNGMDSSKPRSVPTDAREPTEEQRETEDLLEHQNGDPDAPGLQQTHDNVADESTR